MEDFVNAPRKDPMDTHFDTEMDDEMHALMMETVDPTQCNYIALKALFNAVEWARKNPCAYGRLLKEVVHAHTRGDRPVPRPNYEGRLRQLWDYAEQLEQGVPLCECELFYLRHTSFFAADGLHRQS